MKRRNIYPISLAELETLPTKRLLGRLKSLQQCESSVSGSDQICNFIQSNGYIKFKDTVVWKEAYQNLKQVLAGREHVTKGAELVARRKQKAQRNKTAEKRIGRTQLANSSGV